MEHIKTWFHNHSLRFKIVVLFGFFVIALQILSMFLYIILTDKNFEQDITESNLDALSQLSVNFNEVLTGIMEETSRMKVEMLTSQLYFSGDSYASNNIIYQTFFNDLLAAGENYKYVDSMIVVSGQENVHCFFSEQYMRLNQTDLFQKISNDFPMEGQYYWTDVLPADYYFSNNQDEIFSIITPVKRYGSIKSYLVVNIGVDKIYDYFHKSNVSGKNLFLQLNEKDWIPFTEESHIRLMDKNNHNLTDMSRSPVEHTPKYILLTTDLTINKWKLSMIYEKNRIRNDVPVISGFIFLLILAVGGVLVFGGGFIVYCITKPIKKLTESMENNTGTHHLVERFPAKYHDEVGVLANTYNHMMDEIQQLMKDIEKEQIQGRIDYLKMLQLQIQPHFLYNSLESAKLLFEMNDSRAVEMVEAIGQFYKLSMNGIGDVVSMQEEIEHLIYYLKIMKIRYSSKYDYEITVPDAIKDCEIIKFSLQPLVENAIYHGIKLKNKKGIIRVTGNVCEDRIYLTVWDDGVGIPKEKLEELRKNLEVGKRTSQTEHIGMINVQHRLEIQYGKPFGLQINSEEGEYTEVTMIIPFR